MSGFLPGPAPRSGDLEALPLPRLLHLLLVEGLTGVLRLELPSGPAEIYLVDGQTSAVELPGDLDRLGQVLVASGIVDEERMKRALQAPRASGVRYGRLLVDGGLITEQQLRAALRLQIRRRLHRLFFSGAGRFVVDDQPHDRGVEGMEAVRVHPWRAIWQGVRSSWDDARMGAFLGAGRYRLRAAPELIEAYGFGDAEKPLLHELRGRPLAAAELQAALPSLPPPVIRAVLYTLLATDAILDEAAVSAAMQQSARAASVPLPVREEMTLPNRGGAQSAAAGGTRPPTAAAPSRPERPTGSIPVTAPPPRRADSIPSMPPRRADSVPSTAPPPRRADSIPVTAPPPRRADSIPSTAPPPRRADSIPSMPPQRATDAMPTTPPPPRTTGSMPTAAASAGGAGPSRRDSIPDFTPSRMTGLDRSGPAVTPDALARVIQQKASTVEKEDFFQVLGVSREADKTELKNAWLSAAKLYHPDRLTSQGLTLLRAEAERIFRRVSEAYATLSDDQRRGAYLARLTKPAEVSRAEVDAQRVVAAEMAFMEGEVAFKRRDYTTAIDRLQKAVDLNPADGESLAMLAWVRVTAQQATIDAVTLDLERAVQISPRCARAQYYLGLALKASGDFPRAIQHFKKASAIDPRLAEVQSELRVLEARSSRDRTDAKKGLFDRLLKK